MLRSASAMMTFSVQPFVNHVGQRFPVDLVLPGRKEVDDQLRTITEIRLAGEAFAQLSTLYFDVRITAIIQQPCRRCLDPVTSTVRLDEAFEISIPPGVEAVDLWPEVLSMVLSAHDPNVVCKRDCRGLCPICGVNLNREPGHRCDANKEEPRTLRDLVSWTNDS